jgi:hypothetical protein
MLNKTQLKAAVKKYSGLKESNDRDSAKEAIIQSKEYSDEEAEQIVAAIYDTENGATAVEPKKAFKPNDELDLSGFDYKNLTGKKFKEYVELVGDRAYVEFDSESGTENPVTGKLLLEDVYDFVQHRVDVVMKARFPGVKDTPYDFNGLKVKNDTPEHTTRISVRHALEFNLQILNAHSRAGHGKYYFLKK